MKGRTTMCKTACESRRGTVRKANGSKWIRKDARLAIYLRDKFTCIYCLRDLSDAAPMDVTLDHIIPWIDGGSNGPDNLITACRTCNSSRQDKPIERFTSAETCKHIKRNTARPMAAFRTLAKALILDRTGGEDD
jgi:5-methylcytosine-specific restriction endonuclease McrA